MINLPENEKCFWREALASKRTLKDLNYLHINKDLNYRLIALSYKKTDDLYWVAKHDSDFLAAHNIMDYSLLVTIEALQQNLGE